MNLLREYIRGLVESEYRRIQDESDQCTNATVLAIAHHFGDDVPPDACMQAQFPKYNPSSNPAELDEQTDLFAQAQATTFESLYELIEKS